MNIFEYLQLRNEWEEITRGWPGIPQQGTIQGLEKFINIGARKNRFRNGFDRAMGIATKAVART